MENKESKIYLGLDISTTCLGITLYKHNTGDDPQKGEIIMITGLPLKVTKNIKGVESLFLKRIIFRNKLRELKELVKSTYNKGIDCCVIEEPLLSSNNMYTCATLLKFNGIVSADIYDEIGVVPEYISSYDSRYYAFPELVAVHTYNKKNEKRPMKEINKAVKDSKIVLFGSYPFQIEKKQVILDKITELYPNIDWLYNKKGELSKSNYDGSDSLCCIIGYLNKQIYNSEKLTISDYKEYDNSIMYNTTFDGVKKWNHNVIFIE